MQHIIKLLVLLGFALPSYRQLRQKKTMKEIRNILLVVLMLVNYSISAQEIITDRPDQTESSSTIPKGSLQIESGLLFGFSSKDLISEREFLGPTTLFRLALSKGIEIRVVNQFESKNDTITGKVNGISDLEFGAKIQLLRKENIKIEIAFLSHLVIPTGSKELTNDKFGTVNKLAISHGLGESAGIGYNLGYNYFGSGNGDLTYSLVLGIGITDKMAIYLEPYGEIAEFENHISNMDAGITYLIKDNFQLDFSFGTGINHTMNYMSIGFSWEIGKNAQ